MRASLYDFTKPNYFPKAPSNTITLDVRASKYEFVGGHNSVHRTPLFVNETKYLFSWSLYSNGGRKSISKKKKKNTYMLY